MSRTEARDRGFQTPYRLAPGLEARIDAGLLSSSLIFPGFMLFITLLSGVKERPLALEAEHVAGATWYKYFRIHGNAPTRCRAVPCETAWL
jgi:hypothetical protein